MRNDIPSVRATFQWYLLSAVLIEGNSVNTSEPQGKGSLYIHTIPIKLLNYMCTLIALK